MAALNFPPEVTGQNTGTTYTGSNGVAYIWDGYKWVGHSPTLAPGTNSISNNGNVVQVDQSGNLVIPDGKTILYAGGGSPITGGNVGTSWNLTSQGNGCPINVTLTTTTFDVQVPKNHLFFRDDGSWDIGSYFNETYITGDISGGNGIGLTTDRGTVLFGNSPEICGPTGSSHFHIMKQDPTLVDLFFGDDFNNLKLPTTGGVSLQAFNTQTTISSTWTFDGDGLLTLPSGNTRIGSFDGGNSDSILASTGTIFGIIAQGAMGTAGLQWIEDISSIGSTSTRTAGIAVNPFGGTTGTVQIVTGVTTGTGVSNTWEFGTDGNLTLPTGGSIYGLSIIGGEGTNVQADHATEQVYITAFNTLSQTSNVWTFGNDGILKFPGETGYQATFGSVAPIGDILHSVNSLYLESEGNVSLTSGGGAGLLENINVSDLDELVPPGGVWRLFIDATDYPNLGATLERIGTGTVTTAWGTPITATVTGIDLVDGDWQIQVDQDITAGFDAGPKVVTFGVSSQTYTFGQYGLSFPQGSIFGTGLDNDEFILDSAGNKSFSIYTYGGPDTYRWKFGIDGALTVAKDIVVGTNDGHIYIDNDLAGASSIRWVNLNPSSAMLRVWSDGRNDLNNQRLELGYDLLGGLYITTTQNVDGLYNNPGNDFNWTFGADGTTTFPDNTIKTTTSTKITVLGASGTTGTYAWYNIFGELNNSTSTQNTTDGSVAYDSDGNVYVLGSTTDWADGQNFAGTNLFIKYSPQGELLWRKTWTDPTGDSCGSYNASMRFVPLAGTATAGIVWASNGQGWTSGDRIGYVGTMDLDGNLVDLYGNARAPRAVSDYRITDIVLLEYGGFDGAYISGSWWDRAGTGDSYASIGGLDFNNNAISGTNFVFIPADQQSGYDGAHFKSINGVGGGLWATGSYPNTTYSGTTKTPIVGIIEAANPPIPYLFTIGEDYISYDMWIEDSSMDDAYNAYMLVNVYGYNHSVHSSANDYTVVLSNSLSTDLAIDRWQKNITRVGVNDGRFSTLGLGLVNYGDYVYVSMYLGETGNDSDLALLKLNAATGELVWARTIGSPANEGNWNFYSDGWNSSSDITIDPTGTYITFSANTLDHSTSSQYSNNLTIQYPLNGSLLGTYGDFTITDSTADFLVSSHDFTVNNITSSTTITQLSLSVSTATLTASATTVGSGWTNIRQPMGYDGPVGSTPDQTWTFGSDGSLAFPTAGAEWPVTEYYVPTLIGKDQISFATYNAENSTSSYAVSTQDNKSWEVFAEDDSTRFSGWAYLRVELPTIDTPTVFIQNRKGVDGIDHTWEFDANGKLTVPGDIQDANGSVVRVASTSTAPARVDGQLWFNNVEGRLYIKDNGVWVDSNPTVIPPPSTYLDEITVEGSTFTINGSTLTIDSTGTLLVNGGQVTGGSSGNVGFEYATIQEGLSGFGPVTSITGNHNDGLSLTSDDWAQLMWVPDTRSVTIGDIDAGGAVYNWAYVGSQGFHIENKSTSTRSWLFDTDGNIELPGNGLAEHGPARLQSHNGYPTLMAYGSGGMFGLHGGPELDWMDSDYPDRDFFNNTTTRHTLYLNNNGLYVGINENNVAGQPSVSWNFNPDGSLTLPLEAKLNSGGVGVANSAEFGTSVTVSTSTVVNSEIYMGSGYGEFRSIYNKIGEIESGLTYAGVEGFNYAQYGDVNFSGMVSQTPHIDSMYTISVSTTTGQISIGFTQDGGTSVSKDWITVLGTLNAYYTVNGIFADTTQTVIAGGDGVLSSIVKLTDSVNITTIDSITTSTQTWTFGQDGSLAFPNATGFANSEIYTTNGGFQTVFETFSTDNRGLGQKLTLDYDDAAVKIQSWPGMEWKFGQFGDLILPKGGVLNETPDTVTLSGTQTDGSMNVTYTRGNSTDYYVLGGSNWSIIYNSSTYSLTYIPQSLVYMQSTDLITWTLGPTTSLDIQTPSTGTLTIGSTKITSKDKTWSFGTDGSLLFPDGATINQSVITAAPNDYLYLYGGDAQESSGQSVRIYGSNAQTTSTSTVYYGGNVRLYGGRGVNGGEGGEIRLRTWDATDNSNSWYFNADGTLSLPGTIAFQGWSNNIGRYNNITCATGTATVIWTSSAPSVTSMRVTVHAEIQRGNGNYWENFDTETTELLVAIRYENNLPTLARVAVIGSVSTLDTSLATYDVRINGSYLVELTCTPNPAVNEQVITKVEYSESGSSSGEKYC